MSRTYRKQFVSEYKIRGIIYDDTNIDKVSRDYNGIWYYGGHKYVIKKLGKDKKPWYKPTKKFKHMKRKLERTRTKNAVCSGKEIIPLFKKSDIWEWN